MMTKITSKEMIHTYFTSQCDNEVWLAFYTLRKCRLISDGTWNKFYDMCCDWTYDPELQAVVTFSTGEKVIL